MLRIRGFNRSILICWIWNTIKIFSNFKLNRVFRTRRVCVGPNGFTRNNASTRI
ncbi:MAG TPA: hypothetical protein [Caudoviricetes sp.]|nr:MAG TPA: hypothetical protein [Caudoviricetes sp.]